MDARQILREIREGYPDALSEDDIAEITRVWTEKLQAHPDGWRLLFPILRNEVAGLSRSETLKKEKEAQQAYQDSLVGDEPPAFGAWEKKNSGRRRHKKRTKPARNASRDRMPSFLDYDVKIDGISYRWGDVTLELADRRIAEYTGKIVGLSQSRSFVERQREILQEAGTKTLQEAYAKLGLDPGTEAV